MGRSTKTAAKAAKTNGKGLDKQKATSKQKNSSKTHRSESGTKDAEKKPLNSNLENEDWHNSAQSESFNESSPSKTHNKESAEQKNTGEKGSDTEMVENDRSSRSRSRSRSRSQETPDRKGRQKFANERSPRAYRQKTPVKHKKAEKSVKRSLNSDMENVTEGVATKKSRSKKSAKRNDSDVESNVDSGSENGQKGVVFDEMEDVELEVGGVETDYGSELESETDSDSSSSSSSSDGDSTDTDGEQEEKTQKSDEQRLQEMEEDPVFMKFMGRVLAKHGIGSSSNNSNNEKSHSKKRKRKAKKEKRSKRHKGKHKSDSIDKVGRGRTENRFKSPSDSTLYSPALRKKRFDREPGVAPSKESTPVSVADITKFISDIRFSGRKGRSDDSLQDAGPETPSVTAKGYADQQIIDAEKFRATVAHPGGRNNTTSISPLPNNNASVVSRHEGCVPAVDHGAHELDSQFYAVTSHVEDKTEQKICYGKFVDMDDILPKEKEWVQSI